MAFKYYPVGGTSVCDTLADPPGISTGPAKRYRTPKVVNHAHIDQNIAALEYWPINPWDDMYM